MFQPPTPYHNQQSTPTNPTSVPGSSALVPVDLNENHADAHPDVQDRELEQIEGMVQDIEKQQTELQLLGEKIRKHEDNLSRMNSQKSKLDDSILHLQVTIGKLDSSSTPKVENGYNPLPTSYEEVTKQLSRRENSAAGILCQIKTRHGTQASNLNMTKDVLGIVATLGQVEDDNLNRLLSEYLGVDTMMAIVCRTLEGVRALEMYDKDGNINKSCGLHGLGASIGRGLDDRFEVICLEHLRPYPGKHVADDPQRKLDFLIPKLPNGECPAGFLGFAVNMINIDSSNLFTVSASGYGLRESLFYNLFSRLQVYKTRAEMIQALPLISDGAISLDGGMVRSGGVYYLGNREDVDVMFTRPDRSMGLDNHHLEIERQINDLKWKKDRLMDDINRERTLLDVAKFSFAKKKNHFLKILAQKHANEAQTTPGNCPPKC